MLYRVLAVTPSAIQRFISRPGTLGSPVDRSRPRAHRPMGEVCRCRRVGGGGGGEPGARGGRHQPSIDRRRAGADPPQPGNFTAADVRNAPHRRAGEVGRRVGIDSAS